MRALLIFMISQYIEKGEKARGGSLMMNWEQRLRPLTETMSKNVFIAD